MSLLALYVSAVLVAFGVSVWFGASDKPWWTAVPSPIALIAVGVVDVLTGPSAAQAGDRDEHGVLLYFGVVAAGACVAGGLLARFAAHIAANH